MKYKKMVLILALLGFFGSIQSLLAADTTLFGKKDEKFGVKAPGITFTWFSGFYLHGLDQRLFSTEDRFTKTLNFGFRAGYALTKNIEFEGAFGFTPTQNSTSEENIYTYLFNVLGQWVPMDSVVPYLTFGLGGIQFSPDIGTSDNRFQINYGAGMKWFMCRNLALRPEFTALTNFNPTHTAFLPSINLTYYMPIGSQKATPPEAAPPPKPTPAATGIKN